ncbi:MAG: hypothetical protein V1927_05725 [Candidatus Omnitrophota bacterium]
MVIPDKLRLAFRIISACVAGIFLFQQIAWAGDLIEVTLDRQAQAQAETFAPAYLKNQQVKQETLIVQKQDIEDFLNANLLSTDTKVTPIEETLPLKGPMSTEGAPVLQAAAASGGESPQGSGGDPQSDSILSIITQAGDIIHYKDGVIDYVEKKNEDGSFTVIRRIAGLDFVDGSNNLLNAEITYPDNTIEEVRGGRVEAITAPDGAIYRYNTDELIKYVLYKDKTITIYTYGKDREGKDETKLEDYLNGSYAIEEDFSITILPLEEGSEELHKPEKTVRYNDTGKLKEVVFKTGKTILYDSGMISYLKDENGIEYFFENRTESDGITEIGMSKIVNAGETTYVTFDGEGNVVISPDEGVGGLRGAYDAAGSLIMVDDHGTIVTKEYLDIQNETVIAPIENEWSRCRNNSLHYAGIFFSKMSACDYWTDVCWGNHPLPGGISHQEAWANRAKAEDELEAARADMDAAYALERPAREASRNAFMELKPYLDIFWKFSGKLSGNDSITDAPFLKVQYKSDGSINEVQKVDGTIQTYTNGLMDSILNGSILTLYTYNLSALNNINEITVDRDGIKRIYDAYGDLKTLSLENRPETPALSRAGMNGRP